MSILGNVEWTNNINSLFLLAKIKSSVYITEVMAGIKIIYRLRNEDELISPILHYL